LNPHPLSYVGRVRLAKAGLPWVDLTFPLPCDGSVEANWHCKDPTRAQLDNVVYTARKLMLVALGACHQGNYSTIRPELRQDYPLNLSISLDVQGARQRCV
jgi:hypothetical protein